MTGNVIDFTPEELAKIKAICEKFSGRVTSITNKIKGEEDGK